MHLDLFAYFFFFPTDFIESLVLLFFYKINHTECNTGFALKSGIICTVVLYNSIVL